MGWSQNLSGHCEAAFFSSAQLQLIPFRHDFFLAPFWATSTFLRNGTGLWRRLSTQSRLCSRMARRRLDLFWGDREWSESFKVTWNWSSSDSSCREGPACWPSSTQAWLDDHRRGFPGAFCWSFSLDVLNCLVDTRRQTLGTASSRECGWIVGEYFRGYTPLR